jgi:hypothetical protein
MTYSYDITVEHRARRTDPSDLRAHRVEVEIDLDEIARILGTRAARSKGQRAIGLSGLIRVKVQR